MSIKHTLKDKFRDECGVFGIFGHPEAAALTALGLHALQHRGQESCGIVASDSEMFHSHRATGRVGDNFSDARVVEKLPGYSAIGHNRYSTTGPNEERNIQPMFADYAFGGFALAHNGNLTNAVKLRQELMASGSIFNSTSDTETLIHLVALSPYPNVTDKLVDAAKKVVGAYSLVALSRDMLIGMRDPFGVRPLVLGQLDGAWLLASESVAFDIIGANLVRELEPGEMVVIKDNGLESFHPFTTQKQRFCIFEFVYFSRPDSEVEGSSVYNVRKRIGQELAKEAPIEADIVVPVPDSGVPAAIGYAEEAFIPFELGIIRNHYVGRTFIEPSDQIRHLGVKLKHNANSGTLKGKRVILVDDSIVRGTTSTKIVEMVRSAGAAEVHMRIASPPTTHSCFYGVDTPERDQLLAARYDTSGMADLIGVDSLSYISIDGLYRACGEQNRNISSPQFCDACFTGQYPITLSDHDEGHTPAQLSLLAENR